MRTRAILLTTTIVFAIMVINYGFNVFLTRQSLMQSMEDDLALACDIADDLVSTKIDLLKSNAKSIVDEMQGVYAPDEIESILRRAMDDYPDCLGLTVFDEDSVLARYGSAPTPRRRLEERYIQAAFRGESLISTTRYDGKDGELVFHVCVPIDKGRALSVTIPGMTFSEMLAKYRLLDTGNIFMIDENGVMLANFRDYMVTERRNFVENADENSKDLDKFLARMLQEESGYGRYELFDVERFCSFKSITRSSAGWSLGVSVPLSETPAVKIRNLLLITATLLFVAGAVLAAAFSKRMSRPYYRIEEQNRRLDELSREALVANEAKSTFLANMSHEMRTPLNAVIGLSELALETEGMPEETAKQITEVYAAGVTLLDIVNDILDISKIESGKLELNIDTYDTASLINNTVAVNVLRIGEKPVKFVTNLDETLPSYLSGDELRVKQVFSNILSNAFKYTNEGVVEWRLSYERDADSVWLVSEVKDTGIGIKEEDVGKLFADYVQVDISSHRKTEGTGLGLAITKQLAELMGGRITVESAYGQGSTFRLRLRQGFVTDTPIGKNVTDNISNHQYTASKRLNVERLPMPYASVLVVDDVKTNLDVARGMIKPYKIRVDCVLSGPEAIEHVKAGHVVYDAIFMDHMMPEMDGIETARRIRALGTEYAENVPIIALTANAIVGSDKMFLANGFQDFLSKPISTKLLDKALRRWVRDKSKEAAAKTEEPAETPKEDAGFETWPPGFHPAGLDVDEGLEKFGGDADTYLDVLRSYARTTPELIRRLEALYAAKDWADYAVTVHGVKGAGYGICARRAGDAAKELETASKAQDEATLSDKHAPFAALTLKLAADIEEALAVVDADARKPMAEKPDETALEKLRNACAVFDMDGADAAMHELEAYEYRTGGELVTWLREQMNGMNFDDIANMKKGAT